MEETQTGKGKVWLCCHTSTTTDAVVIFVFPENDDDHCAPTFLSVVKCKHTDKFQQPGLYKAIASARKNELV